MSRRILRIVLSVLSLIPMGTGLLAIVVGTPGLPEPAEVSATVDTEYRFANVFWFAAGAVLLWSTFRMSERRLVTRLVLALAVAGGTVRLWSVVLVGWPHPVFIGTIVLELVVVPLVLWWHARAVPAGAVSPPASRTSSASGAGGASLRR